MPELARGGSGWHQTPMHGAPAGVNRTTSAWLLLIATLWGQLYVACIYGWQYGEYYSYGWYVPPLVLLFFFRLRGLWKDAAPKPLPPLAVAGGLVALFGILTVLRVLNRVDSRWTLPLWSMVAVVLLVTFGGLYQIGGAGLVKRFIPVILFACTAVPLPTRVEQLFVSRLTDSVIAASVKVLSWVGPPVQAIGDQLSRTGEIVHVTEGCSGIRSAQSFVMAALFFGEWMELKPRGRWLMVVAGFATAWTLNVVRASSLAWIRFERGEDAFQAAHDLAGLLAFAAGSAILLFVSRVLDSDKSERRVLRRAVERGTA